MKWFFKSITKSHGRRASPLLATFDQYEGRPPALQNAVETVPGWSSALPEELGVEAGKLRLWQDERLEWMEGLTGSLAGWRVLELGPLDGAHTLYLHRAGVGRVDAIEAGKGAFLRCLITKELCRMDRAHFYLGDFGVGLGPLASERYDLVVASGVLYHLTEPVALLQRLRERTDRLFIWTHVFDSTRMKVKPGSASPFTGRQREVEVEGVTVVLHERSYLGTHQQAAFCGGPRDCHYWFERESLFALLKVLGFGQVQVGCEEPENPAGPSLAIYATR